jgi:hypothetical protein
MWRTTTQRLKDLEEPSRRSDRLGSSLSVITVAIDWRRDKQEKWFVANDQVVTNVQIVYACTVGRYGREPLTEVRHLTCPTATIYAGSFFSCQRAMKVSLGR